MKNLYILPALLLFLLSCQQSTQSTEDVFYPLKVGNSWDYSRTITRTQTSGEPGALDSLDQIAPTVVHVSVDKKVTLSGELVDTYCIKTREDNNSFYSENYYLNNSDGLYNVAYSNAGSGPLAFPKNTQKPLLKFRGKTYSSIGQLVNDYHIDQSTFYRVTSDSLIFEDPLVQNLIYPLKVGAQWAYRESTPWPMAKRVEAKSFYSVPAGSFDCFEIKLLYDADGNGIWDNDIYILDYIADAGLVQREIHILGLKLSDSSGNELATLDYFEKMVLTAYNN